MSSNAIDILKLGVGIATPLGFLGFATALGYLLYIRHAKHVEANLDKLPVEKRAGFLDRSLGKYGIDASNSTRDEKVKLIKEEMEKRYRFARLCVVVSAFVFLGCFAIAAVAYTRFQGTRVPIETNQLVTVAFSAADDLCLLYLADKEFLDKFAKPPVHADIPSYHGGEETALMVAGLWAGDIASGIRDALFKSLFQKELQSLIGTLTEVKQHYEEGSKRTAALNEAWSLLPKSRDNLTELNQFLRVLYPVPGALRNAQVLLLRDQMIACLSDLWKPAEGNSDHEYTQRLLYDILLWRTTPTFRLRVTNPGSVKAAIDDLQVLFEDFQPMKDTFVSGPVQTLTTVTLKLDGSSSTNVNRPLNVGIAPKDLADIVVRFESTKKGVYRLRLALTSAGVVVWKGDPFNLFFIH